MLGIFTIVNQTKATVIIYFENISHQQTEDTIEKIAKKPQDINIRRLEGEKNSSVKTESIITIF